MISPRIGPYEISRPLGAGGMGEVFLATDTRLGRQVALKRVPGEVLPDAEARERLLREARAAAALNHPGIAAIHDILDVDGRTYIVMEYVPGETLARRLQPGPLPFDLVLEIGCQLLTALEAAHARGIVHRDLKPANIIVLQDGHIKVLDFGLAKVQPLEGGGASVSGDSVTAPGQFVGTPGYAAPEQLLGEPVDARSDLFSVGVVLFELATGRRPFQAHGAFEQAMAVLQQDPPSAHAINPAVPADFSVIVARAMARKRPDRHPSAAALRAELEELASRRRASATLSGRSWPARPSPASPWRWWAGGTLAAAVLVLAALLLVDRSSWTPPDHPVIAVLPLANLTGDEARDYLGVGIADALVTRLASMPAVTVLSRASVSQHRGERDPRRLSRQLGANVLIDGGVQVVGETLRVSVALVRPDGSVAWAREYEDREDRLLRLQGLVALHIIEGLRLTTTAADRERLAQAPTASVAAYADYARGRTLLERPDVPGNVEGAIVSFERAIERDPQFALAHAALADAHWARYQETREAASVGRAVDASHDALRLDPQQADVRVTLARVYQGTGRTDAALEELHRALELQPTHDEAHRLLGETLAAAGRMDEAVEAMERAIAVRPGFWGHPFELGFVLYQAGRYEAAAEAFRESIALEPDNFWTHHALGTVYHATGDHVRALEHYGRALELGEGAATYANTGIIHYDQGRFEEAVRMFEEAIRLRPNEAVNHRNLGDAYRRLGRDAEAAAAWERAIELAEQRLAVNPRDGDILGLLAVCQAKVGRFDEARRHADAAVAVGSTATALYRRAVVLALSGERGQALAALAEALEHGYAAQLAAKDEDLASLREAPEFVRLVNP